MSNLAEKYDFSMFGNTAPDIRPVEEPRPKAPRPTRQPKQKQLPKTRIKRNWAKIGAWSCVFATMTGLAALRVDKEVELTMLTDQIQTVRAQLDEAQAEEVQLRMKADMFLNGTGLEKYAKEKLGMQPIKNDQVIYFNGERTDKGTVYAPADDANVPVWEKVAKFFEKVFS